MPSFTKKAIMESFLHLVEKKPLEKITVRDLVDECGINRNTFYYYFQDIYAVLEEYCEQSIDALAGEKSPVSLLCGLLRFAEDFARTRPRAAKMIAFSLGHEGLERYLGKRAEPALRAAIREKTDKEPGATLLRFLMHAIIGLCLDIMRAEKGIASATQDLEAILTPLLG